MTSFSIIIPVFNESNNIALLIKEIQLILQNYKKFEIIIVNDGSNDNTSDVLQNIEKKFPITIIQNDKNLGQSLSIWKGAQNSNYDTIITIDGDGQNNPKDIPMLIDVFFSEKKYSLVGGIRKKRKDSLIKILSSKFANKIRSYILQDDCPDTGCSLKVFNKEIFLQFPFFNGIHRFLPALFKGYGEKTFFLNVDHRHRAFGTSKYGTFGRLFRGVRDLIKVAKIIKKFKSNRA